MVNEDKQFILSIIEKFNSSNIAELELDDGSVRLTLRKKTEGKTILSDSAISVTDSAESGTAISNEKKFTRQEKTETTTAPKGEKITSPIVGTFYAAPGADAPPFVKPGSKVKAGQILCILEAMKMMNKLEAEYDCEIIKVHSGNGELVEFGQDIFTVKRF